MYLGFWGFGVLGFFGFDSICSVSPPWSGVTSARQTETSIPSSNRLPLPLAVRHCRTSSCTQYSSDSVETGTNPSAPVSASRMKRPAPITPVMRPSNSAPTRSERKRARYRSVASRSAAIDRRSVVVRCSPASSSREIASSVIPSSPSFRARMRARWTMRSL